MGTRDQETESGDQIWETEMRIRVPNKENDRQDRRYQHTPQGVRYHQTSDLEQGSQRKPGTEGQGDTVHMRKA